MSKKLVIMCSGNARCGKNTAADNMIKFCDSIHVKSKIYSFAWALKNDLRELLLEKFNIDSFTEKDEEKTLIKSLFSRDWVTFPLAEIIL